MILLYSVGIHSLEELFLPLVPISENILFHTNRINPIVAGIKYLHQIVWIVDILLAVADI